MFDIFFMMCKFLCEIKLVLQCGLKP